MIDQQNRYSSHTLNIPYSTCTCDIVRRLFCLSRTHGLWLGGITVPEQQFYHSIHQKDPYESYESFTMFYLRRSWMDMD